VHQRRVDRRARCLPALKRVNPIPSLPLQIAYGMHLALIAAMSMRISLWYLAFLVTAGCSEANGTNPDAGDADSGACPVGQITFVLRRAAGSATTYCVGAPNSCSHDWLSIIGPGGSSFPIDKPCQTECSTCEPVGCPAICAAPTAMKQEGEQRTWSGTYYAASTCGSGSACVGPACVSAGRYTARMCAYAEADMGQTAPFCNAVQTPTCVSVDFDWPPPGGSGTLTGVIGEGTDGEGSEDGSGIAGTCCPANWLMYPCTYADGGTGQACHNPALGCASSLTCGEGCDRVVTGRCDTQ
jgi:hypothetical protein